MRLADRSVVLNYGRSYKETAKYTWAEIATVQICSMEASKCKDRERMDVMDKYLFLEAKGVPLVQVSDACRSNGNE